jgi:hypothetical protein
MIIRLLIACVMLFLPAQLQAQDPVIGPGHEAFVEDLISGKVVEGVKTEVHVLGIQIQKDHLIVNLEGAPEGTLSLHPRGQVSEAYAQTTSFDVSWSGVRPDAVVDAFVRGLTQRDLGVFWDRVQIEAKDGVSNSSAQAICRRVAPGYPACCSSVGLCPQEEDGLKISSAQRKLLLIFGSLAWMVLLGLWVFALTKVDPESSPEPASSRLRARGFVRGALGVVLVSALFLAVRFGLIGSLIPADQRVLLWDEIQHIFVENESGWSAHGAVWLYGVVQYFTGLSLLVLVPALSALFGLLTLWMMAYGIYGLSRDKRITGAFLGLAICFPPLALQGALVSFGHVTSFLWVSALWSAWAGIEQRRWRPVAWVSTLLLGFCGPLAGLMMIPCLIIIHSYGPGSTRWRRPVWMISCGLVALQSVILSLSAGVGFSGLPVDMSVTNVVLLSLWGVLLLLGMLRSRGSARRWWRWATYVEILLVAGCFLIPGPQGWQTPETFFTLALWLGCPLALYGAEALGELLERKTGRSLAPRGALGWVGLAVLLSLCWRSGVQNRDSVERVRGDWMARVNSTVWPALGDLEGSIDLILMVPDNFPVLPAEWSELLGFQVAARSLLPRPTTRRASSHARSCLIWQIHRAERADADTPLGKCGAGGASAPAGSPRFRWQENGAVSRLLSCAPSRCAALSEDASFSTINTLSDADMSGRVSVWLQHEKKP